MIAEICKQLLYIDYYFRNIFIKAYSNEIAEQPNADTKIQFANNARTVCIAFVMFASRYKQGNISSGNLKTLFEASKKDQLADNESVFKIVSNLEKVSWVLPTITFEDKDQYNKILYKLFELIIKHGSHDLMIAMEKDETITATNFLKKDKNYIDILRMNWDDIHEKIKEVLP